MENKYVSKRINALESFKQCPIRKNMILKIGDDGMNVCKSLIYLLDDKSYGQFNSYINDFFMNKGKQLKNWQIIANVLSEANGVLMPTKQKNKLD